MSGRARVARRRRADSLARALVAVVLGLTVALVAVSGAAVAGAAGARATLPECATEDSEQCYWDAGTMGNGTGRDFVRFDGVTYFADEAGR